MNYYETLFNTKEEKTCGNHRAKVEYYGKEKYCIRFYYFDTLICVAYPADKTFMLTDGGWNTISTHKAIMNYKRYLESRHFHLTAISLCGFYGLPKDLIRKEKDCYSIRKTL